MSFGTDLRRFRIKTLATLEQVYRASLFDLNTAIILGTPVDKGILRNNWYISFIDDTELTTSEPAPTGTSTIERAKASLQNVGISSVVYIFNNLPYGPAIEYDGHSGKAPEGMVRINVAKWDAIVSKNARKFR